MKDLIPATIRSRLRRQRRNYRFARAMKSFVKSPDPKWIPDLIDGWNNRRWSALDEYLSACIIEAQSAKGDILECGSGLSTLLIGAIAQRTGKTVWTLEHNDLWASRLREHLDRYHIKSVTLSCAPLLDYGDYQWYAPPPNMPERFALAICDGPPGTTKGGRYGLTPIMGERLAGCIILLDDAEREEEQVIAKRWSSELGAEYATRGAEKPFIRLHVPPQ